MFLLFTQGDKGDKGSRGRRGRPGPPGPASEIGPPGWPVCMLYLEARFDLDACQPIVRADRYSHAVVNTEIRYLQ